ncbi:MAG: DNA (cytosine-5-)-methyltransferase [Bacteroidaceae bacterium]|nr:DNA (cytosine-5-)-methyltransferase [Bacteroidaceae bacterium]
MKKKEVEIIKNISSFPSEEKDGLTFYDETSLDNQVSVMSQYLHNLKWSNEYNNPDSDLKNELISRIRDFVNYKIKTDKKAKKLSEEDIWRIAENPFESDLFLDFFKVPFPDPNNPQFTFIDLFAGIGGFRIAMQEVGGKCVYSSEWNVYAQKTYLANFGELPFGDITKESTKSYIPQNFDILCAGFPCQPFSIAGVSKKKSLGRETGFKDKTQGTLFFDVADIINRHRPKAFFLENVKNLTSHDKGNTFKVIKETLEGLGYSLYYQVMDGKYYVPQHRERILLVGFNKDIYHGQEVFNFPEQKGETDKKIKDILLKKADPKYTLSDKLWGYLQMYAEKHKAKGNGFGYGMVDLNGISRTLSARYYKDGSEILIPQANGKNPRRLTPRECARLMGYPDTYIIDKVSDVQAYRQCGNSVIVPLITDVARNIVETLKTEVK